MTVVVDASFAGSWILPDEHSGESESVLRAVLQGKEDLAAPDLWIYEMLNLLLSACRRGRVRHDRLEQAVRLVQRIPVNFHDHQTPLVQNRVIRLAGRFSLSAYDAAYLELADRLQCPLRSQDRSLAAAAGSLGLA
ncbi:MAG: type II toxin-antitoxin system VapC family toxin [Acidobacteria bacterium]|nr:type II toxin-antitoxin system VapC family toxin [Acidobacteriota bacterium]